MAQSNTEVKILVPGHHSMVALLGQRDELLKLVESAFASRILVRGNEITIKGDRADVERVATLFEELIELLERGHELTPESLTASIDMVKTEEEKPREVLGDALLVHRGKAIRPKTLGQKRYVDAIRRSTIVFAVGPAGTGKTYLAMAMAVKALQDKQIGRLILTRPAVEAGEKLGYLPGTLYEKIDPYMRPLYDALYDMLDADALGRLTQRGTVEVSPLAYMRGRAQPYSSRVLTPTGYRTLRDLSVGDLVVGSSGWPTPVLGIYPQGHKEIFRVRTQDGAATLCCAEHLWAVTTASDKRRGKPPRVLQTQDMIGRLRQFHQRRFELPILQAPVEFLPREVPLDGYALGLLLGDGCITGKTTPSFTTADTQLAEALEASLDGIELRAKGEFGYVLRNPGGRRGWPTTVHPVSAVLSDLALRGTRSSTKFIPKLYLVNSTEVRLAVLQGLLDTDGGPVTQSARTCRIQYVTTSPQLRDDVVFLVRSLGGVAYPRTRSAAGRKPGRAKGRDILYRSDAYVLDIRLPPGLSPFRLRRKAEVYRRYGGGRPMRFIDSIEPAGGADTVCISVAAADSLYVTDDFLVTHNTINDSFIILDEAQNSTKEQMKMFLTRLGFGSKVVVTGDVTQIDLPSGQASGLNVVREILTDIQGLEFVYLTARDVVRHKLVQEIVEAYRRFDESRGEPR